MGIQDGVFFPPVCSHSFTCSPGVSWVMGGSFLGTQVGRAGQGPASRQSQDRTGDSAYAARGGPVPSSLPGSSLFTSPPVPRRGQKAAEGCRKVQEAEPPQVPCPRGAPPPSTFSLPLSCCNVESQACSPFHGFLVLLLSFPPSCFPLLSLVS